MECAGLIILLASIFFYRSKAADFNASVGEIQFSPSEAIDVSAGPVKVRLSYNYSISSNDWPSPPYGVNTRIWYGRPLDAQVGFDFFCRAHRLPLGPKMTYLHISSEIKQYLGPGPYNVSTTSCQDMMMRLERSIASGVDPHLSGKIEVEVTFSLASLSMPTNIWTAVVDGDSRIRAIPVSPSAILTVGVLKRKIGVTLQTTSDGNITMNFTCTIGPVIPDVELVLTLPAEAGVAPIRAYNQITVSIPYAEGLNNRVFNCDAMIVHPNSQILQQEGIVQYAPVYHKAPTTVNCEGSCDVSVSYCLDELVLGYPKTNISWIAGSTFVTGRKTQNVTILCTAANSLGKSTMEIDVVTVYNPATQSQNHTDKTRRYKTAKLYGYIVIMAVPWVLLISLTAVMLILLKKNHLLRFKRGHVHRPTANLIYNTEPFNGDNVTADDVINDAITDDAIIHVADDVTIRDVIDDNITAPDVITDDVIGDDSLYVDMAQGNSTQNNQAVNKHRYESPIYDTCM